MNVIRFMQEYVKQPRMVGAILPSSKKLAKQMVSSICFKKQNALLNLVQVLAFYRGINST